MVYLNGYSLLSRHSDIWLAVMLDRLSSLGIPLVVDVAGAACHRELRPLLYQIMLKSCLVKMNRREATCFTQTSEIEDQSKAISPLLKKEGAVCLISRDADGCIAVRRDGFVRFPALEISSLRNADGAGDVLFCTFAWNYLMRGLSIEDCTEVAIARATNWVLQDYVAPIDFDAAAALRWLTRPR